MKTINIPVQVPDDYKFLALQPFGNWTAFKRKPTLYSEIEFEGEPPVEYWNLQKDELELTTDGPELENWKDSLREI